jgi:hypothetical protein
MEQTIQHSQKNKLRRNSFCVCGSGKKYKKCCLNKKSTFNKHEIGIQSTMKKFRKKHRDQGIMVLDSEKMGLIKMSEIILEYADELIDMADTKESKENAIRIAIAAWNISFYEKEQRKEKIEEFLHAIKLKENSNDWNEARDVLQELINKKLENYSFFDRFIVDYEFFKLSSGDYHLNIISTIYDS